MRASIVARALADGNTLLVATSSTLAINPSLYKKLSYDPLKDFVPVGMIGAVPLVVVVNADVPVNSIGEGVASAAGIRSTLLISAPRPRSFSTMFS